MTFYDVKLQMWAVIFLNHFVTTENAVWLNVTAPNNQWRNKDKQDKLDFGKLDHFKAMKKTFTMRKRSSLYKYNRVIEYTPRVL
jgi:hypothetical protein